MFNKILNQYFKGLAFTAISVLALWPQNQTEACSVCGTGDPLVAAGDARPVAGELKVAIENQFLTATAVMDDNPMMKESLMQYSVRPVFVYSPAEFMNFVVAIPLTYKDFQASNVVTRMPMDGSRLFGLADIDIGTRWFLFQKADLSRQMRHSLSLTAGLTLPTGNNDASQNGMRLDEHAQIGTGSWGPYAGLMYAFHRDPWNFSVYGAFRYHTANKYNYVYGAGVLAGIAGQFRIWEPFAVTLGVDARYAFNDNAAGIVQVNTGGAVLNITPGFIVNIAGGLWLKGNAQVPVYTKLSGKQGVGATFNLNIEYSFHN